MGNTMKGYDCTQHLLYKYYATDQCQDGEVLEKVMWFEVGDTCAHQIFTDPQMAYGYIHRRCSHGSKTIERSVYSSNGDNAASTCPMAKLISQEDMDGGPSTCNMIYGMAEEDEFVQITCPNSRVSLILRGLVSCSVAIVSDFCDILGRF